MNNGAIYADVEMNEAGGNHHPLRWVVVWREVELIPGKDPSGPAGKSVRTNVIGYGSTRDLAVKRAADWSKKSGRSVKILSAAERLSALASAKRE